MTEERIISALRKAWVDPQGTVKEFEHQHHYDWLLKNAPDVAFSESHSLGWIRLTRRGQALDIEGMPDMIDRYKLEILMWAGRGVQWVNIDPTPMEPSIGSSLDTFVEQDVSEMMHRSRMTGGTVFRRRPEVRVRAHRRRA
jgi:hypothetical protein